MPDTPLPPLKLLDDRGRRSTPVGAEDLELHLGLIEKKSFSIFVRPVREVAGRYPGR